MKSNRTIRITYIEDGSFLDCFEEGKSAVISIGTDIGEIEGMRVAEFPSGSEQKAWQQAKRFISSQAFDNLALVNMAQFIDEEMYFWITDHRSKVGFPNLVITGKNPSPYVSRIVG